MTNLNNSQDLQAFLTMMKGKSLQCTEDPERRSRDLMVRPQNEGGETNQ